MYKRVDIEDLSFLFRGKPLKILLSINEENNFASIISKETQITYAHTHNVLSSIEKVGLIEFKKINEYKKNITLTKKGLRLQKLLQQIGELMEGK